MSSRPRQPRPFPFVAITGRPGAIAVPARPRASTVARTSRESGLVVFAIFLYFLVRGMMSTSVDRAYDHAYSLLDLERALGIAWEADLQRWASDIPWLMSAMNSAYIYGHWPVIALTLGWLLWRHGDQFRTYRTAMVFSGLIGFAFFALYPMAPPRFLDDLGFVDTVMRDTSSYRLLQPTAFTNQYAAMPSLHVGWNVLMGIAIYTTTRNRFWRAFAVIMPLVMWVATILTANHFVLDGVVGSAVALAGLAIARQLVSPRKEDAHEPARSPAGSRGRQGDIPPAAA